MDASAAGPVMPPGALYSPRYPMALAYAATEHAAQSRKDDARTPYIGHPLTVSSFVWMYGWGVQPFAPEIEDLAIAGLLHDVAEDLGGEVKLQEIDAMFGPRVAEVVRAASDSLVEDPNEKSDWRQRKEDHIARVGALASPDPEGEPRDAGACLVIACDKLHNLTETVAGVAREGDGYLDRFRGRAAGTRWYYRSMFEVLRQAIPERLTADLAAALLKLEE